MNLASEGRNINIKEVNSTIFITHGIYSTDWIGARSFENSSRQGSFPVTGNFESNANFNPPIGNNWEREIHAGKFYFERTFIFDAIVTISSTSTFDFGRWKILAPFGICKYTDDGWKRSASGIKRYSHGKSINNNWHVRQLPVPSFRANIFPARTALNVRWPITCNLLNIAQRHLVHFAIQNAVDSYSILDFHFIYRRDGADLFRSYNAR